MATTVVTVVEVLGVEVGHWCRACALPSGIRVLYVTRTGPPMTFRSGLGCTHCDSDDIEVASEARIVWGA